MSAESAQQSTPPGPPGPPGVGQVRVPKRSGWRRLWESFHSRFTRHIALAMVGLGSVAAAGHFIGGVIGWWHLYELSFHAGKPVVQASTTDAKSRRLAPVSVVVLPLASEGDAQGSDWFGDALVADLTTDLGRYSGTEVISHGTASRYKGPNIDPREVSRELGVRYVVRGSLRRDGERIRLSLSMVDGESGKQHWAEQFDMQRGELRQSVDEVAGQVGRSLNVQLLRSEGKRAAALKAEEVQADDLAMQGWEVFYRGANRENMLAAQRLFEAAVASDPNSIRGWGGIGMVNWTGAVTPWMPDRQAAIGRVRVAAERLQTLDVSNFYTLLLQTLLSGLTLDFEGQLVAAAALLEHFPSYPGAHHYRGQALMSLGRFEECVEPSRKAIRLGPRDISAGNFHLQIASCHFLRGEYSQAAEHARIAIQRNPKAPNRHMVLAASLALDGRTEEARNEIAEFRRDNPAHKAEEIGILRSQHPKVAEGRDRMIATLRQLGMP